MHFLKLVQCDFRSNRCLGRLPVQRLIRQKLFADLVRLRENRRPFNRVPQLANVPSPRSAPEASASPIQRTPIPFRPNCRAKNCKNSLARFSRSCSLSRKGGIVTEMTSSR